MRLLAAIHVLHLERPTATLLLLRQRRRTMAPAIAEALIALDVPSLEAEISGRPRAQQDDDEVVPPGLLVEGTMPVLLEELFRVEVLARRLAAHDQEEMIAPQCGGIEEDDEPIHERKGRDAVVRKGRRQARAVGV